MTVKLSGYRVGLSVLVEMDGLQGWQGLSFDIASGPTPMKLRDRVFMILGAALEAHVHLLAKELDIELEAHMYRILDVYPIIRVWENDVVLLDFADTASDWSMFEHHIFGGQLRRKEERRIMYVVQIPSGD